MIQFLQTNLRRLLAVLALTIILFIGSCVKNKPNEKELLNVISPYSTTFQTGDSTMQTQRNDKYTNILKTILPDSTPDHINTSISSSASSSALQPNTPFYIYTCDELKLLSPTINILGFQRVSDMTLVKIFVEDVSHRDLYVLLLDSTGIICDFLRTIEPLNGDQLDNYENTSIEWHYYSDYYYYDNTLLNKVMDCDVKVQLNKCDTLYKKHCLTTYKIGDGKFVVVGSDTVVNGQKY